MRARFPTQLLLAALLALAAGCGGPPPNVILLIGDDHGFQDFGFMGSPHVLTPHLDALAATGTVFPLAHTTGSECKPSLMSLLTGLYPYQWCLRLNALERAQPDLDRTFAIAHFATLPRLLASRGYATFQAGKLWEGTYETSGFSAGMVAEYDPEVPWGNGGESLGRESMQPVYAFIDAHRDGPFFIWFAPMLPHVPHNPPQEFRDLYTDRRLSDSARRYYASCSWYDALVGELVEHLEDRGLRENTLLVYVSDNGWDQEPSRTYRGRLAAFMGGVRGKASDHDLGFRTPIVFNLPGRIPEGHRVDALASTVDLLPTLLGYAGVPIPPRLPGQDLGPVIEGRDVLQREFLFGSMHRVRTNLPPTEELLLTKPVRRFYARSRRWHLVRDETDDSDVLYDLESNPEETRNVADQHPELVRELRSEIEAWKREGMRPFAEELPTEGELSACPSGEEAR